MNDSVDDSWGPFGNRSPLMPPASVAADAQPPAPTATPPSLTWPPAVPTAADPAAPGFAMPAGLAPAAPPTGQPPPGTRTRSRRFAGRRGFAALGIAILVIAAKVLLFSGAFRVISVATTATYHEPSAIAGDAKSSDAAVLATVTQLQNGIQIPALQGGHTEGAGYTDASGNLDYLSVLAQDNANNDSPRQGVNLTALFGAIPGTQLSPPVTSIFNGVNLECATITDVSGTTDPPINACDWYNNDAFGLFVEYKTATLAATQQLETSLLTTLTK